MSFLITNLTSYKRIVRNLPNLVNPASFQIDKELLVDDIEKDLILEKNLYWRKFYLNGESYYVVEKIGSFVYLKVNEIVSNRILKKLDIKSEVKSITHTKNSWFPYVLYNRNLIESVLKLEGKELDWNSSDGFKDLANTKMYDVAWLILNLDQSNIYIKLTHDTFYTYYAFVTNTTKFYSANYNQNKTPHINGGGYVLSKDEIKSILENIRSLQED